MNFRSFPEHSIADLADRLKAIRQAIEQSRAELRVHRTPEYLADPNVDDETMKERVYGIAVTEDRVQQLEAERLNTARQLAAAVARITEPATVHGPPPPHLDPEFGEHDYAGMPALTGADNNGEVMAYESSSAEGPHLWVRAETTDGTVVRVHLTADTAWKFAEQLVTLIRNHCYGDSTPAGAAYRVTPLFATGDAAAAGPELPQDWADLLTALHLLSRHPMPRTGPFYCAHDLLTVCVDGTAFTGEERQLLEKLGFDANSDGGFTSARFGNA